ncbi:a3a765e2-7d29-4731-960f-7c8d98318e36 [Sclerotinia trifoliorum]|uniref:A3a765e2-7d29-4731-960f-7c8d98318e36 n=1 Tax=Sclerotinia trifoliorum TaxID=28548 RepID=A0A8H2ZVB6_9HELO|nr:a3a765e2-7d29-4731-960f-7c8d98318e36 [Sclerotinia trifoliorum]
MSDGPSVKCDSKKTTKSKSKTKDSKATTSKFEATTNQKYQDHPWPNLRRCEFVTKGGKLPSTAIVFDSTFKSKYGIFSNSSMHEVTSLGGTRTKVLNIFFSLTKRSRGVTSIVLMPSRNQRRQNKRGRLVTRSNRSMKSNGHKWI